MEPDNVDEKPTVNTPASDFPSPSVTSFRVGEEESPEEPDVNEEDIDDGSESLVCRLQKAVRTHVDGTWGRETDKRLMQMRLAARGKQGFNILEAQEILGTVDDGFWGPISKNALRSWIIQVQKILNLKPDGRWGVKTDAKLLALRRRYFTKS